MSGGLPCRTDWGQTRRCCGSSEESVVSGSTAVSIAAAVALRRAEMFGLPQIQRVSQKGNNDAVPSVAGLSAHRIDSRSQRLSYADIDSDDWGLVRWGERWCLCHAGTVTALPRSSQKFLVNTFSSLGRIAHRAFF